uniref:Large ribosomal subunit protein uL18c n=1 Tax=Gloeochaete wittrockiana TaxID=38269 RepID=A0A3G1IVZ3_9EUKA|nr:ribosomal protein L18 [Gloeochaete wittrockiana]ASQ40226.1 ribosomal protein L18 [Gloeochaete wittrockiana]
MSLKKKIVGTPDRPRLRVFRSNNHIHAQIIDDTCHKTIVSCSTVESIIKSLKIAKTGNCMASTLVGKIIAERSLEKGIKQVVFDRGNKIYHGRIKSLAEGAREGGLNF